jgi:hypothetical protein
MYPIHCQNYSNVSRLAVARHAGNFFDLSSLHIAGCQRA